MRAAERTWSLVAPATGEIGDAFGYHLLEHLVSGIAPMAERLVPGEPVVVTLPLLRQARTRPESLATAEEPFAWKPAFVRRSLGLAAVDACLDGRFRTPIEAVGPVADEAVAEWERTGWRTFHWEPWFAGLAAGARASVLADAVGWATSLWSSFAWSEFPERPQVGGVDDQWVCPAGRVVRLKGRSEMRVHLPAEGSDRAVGAPSPVALVSVSAGCAGASWSEELAFLALVAAVRSPSRLLPARVFGVWPDAGTHAVVEIDESSLVAAAERVVATVATVVDARHPAVASH
jgi:hypothetical protein